MEGRVERTREGEWDGEEKWRVEWAKEMAGMMEGGGVKYMLDCFIKEKMHNFIKYMNEIIYLC